jgi:hypothetical protein
MTPPDRGLSTLDRPAAMSADDAAIPAPNTPTVLTTSRLSRYSAAAIMSSDSLYPQLVGASEKRPESPRLRKSSASTWNPHSK